MVRLHVEAPLHAGGAFDLSDAQSRYLRLVMRLPAGSEILVFNGRDGEWLCRLIEAGKRGARLVVLEAIRPQGPPSKLRLLIALVKRPRLEAVVEKAVELGVGRIDLVKTSRSVYDRPNLPRLSAIALEAAEQTGRLEAPTIEGPAGLEAAVSGFGPDPLFYCDEAGDDPALDWGGARGRAAPALDVLAAPPCDGAEGAGVLIGPEGGFDPQERAWLRAQPQVRPISLGPRILRVDTAAVAALALVQAVRGDWG